MKKVAYRRSRRTKRSPFFKLILKGRILEAFFGEPQEVVARMRRNLHDHRKMYKANYN